MARKFWVEQATDSVTESRVIMSGLSPWTAGLSPSTNHLRKLHRRASSTNYIGDDLLLLLGSHPGEPVKSERIPKLTPSECHNTK